MSEYRRNRVRGGSYFFTVVLRDRGSALLVRLVDFHHFVAQRIYAADWLGEEIDIETGERRG